MKYYSSPKNNEIMSFAKMWMNPIIVLNEVSQTQKSKCHMLSSCANTCAFLYIIKVEGGLLARRHGTRRREEERMREDSSGTSICKFSKTV